MLGFKKIKQNNVGLVETWGKYNNRQVNAGLHFYLPIVQKITVVNLKMIPIALDSYSVITKDNAEVKAAVTLSYHVTDAAKYEYENSDSVETMIQLVRGHLRDIIGKIDLNEALSSTKQMNDDLTAAIGDLTNTYGVNVDRVNIDELSPSESVTASMEKQLNADREKTAAIAKANGLAESIRIENEANNEKLKNTAKAEAAATKTEADAEAYKIEKINNQLSSADTKYFISQKISAIAKIAESGNLMMIDQDSVSDYGKIPGIGKILNKTKSK